MRCKAAARLIWTVMAFLVGIGASGVAPASAGEFPVRQCQGADNSGFFGEYGNLSTIDRVDAVAGCASQGVGKVGVYQDRSGRSIPFGSGGQFIWAPRTGIQIVGTSLAAKLKDANGMRATVTGSFATTGSFDLYADQPHDGALRTTRWTASGTPADLVIARLSCIRDAGCPNTSDVQKAYFEVFDLEMVARDYISPSVSLDGDLRDLFHSGRWTRGARTFNLTASDWGAGISRAGLEVNGLEVRLPVAGCQGDRATYAVSFAPCPLNVGYAGGTDTATAPFREGENTVRACVTDYAISQGTANRSCSPSGTVLVDNVAPSSPLELEVIGGSSWRATNGFDFTWRVPDGQTSPIVGVEHRVFRVEDGIQVARGESSGYAPTSAGPIEAPGPGVYRAEFRLLDEAGNLGAPASTIVRFDDSPPGNVAPEAPDGWVSADELPLAQGVEAAVAGGPSGVGGYALAVSGNGPVRPCGGSICEPGDMVMNGGPDNRVTLIPNLEEGSHWISAVAASGARVPSRLTGSTVVRVDRTDPVSQISGVPESWVNRPVTVTVAASDELSGMARRPGDDGEPQTVIAPDGQSAYEVPGDRASFTIADEGLTRVRYWAEDLAGNLNDGQIGPGGDRHARPGTAVVRIDTVPPDVSFLPRDPADPELVTASVSDSSSGADRGRIAIRRLGSDEFAYLRTGLDSDVLSARIPSDDLEPGTYELRAEAFDRAGNEGSSVVTQTGSAMVVNLPLKKGVVLSLARDRAVGTGNALVGTVRSESGEGMSGTTLVVEETFAAGSRLSVRTTPITSDGTGRFRILMGNGPSRVVRVLYAGNRLEARAASPAVRVQFRDSTSLRLAPPKVRNGSRVRMRGRVRGPGAILPAGGKLVAIQFFDPSRSRWRPVEVIRTKPSGRFTYAYRFRTITSAQRIRFRAVSLPEAGWPYLPSTSASRSVIVYPAGA